MALLPGKKIISSFENKETLSSIRGTISKNFQNVVEAPMTVSEVEGETTISYQEGILRQVVSSAGYPTTVIATVSDMIPATATLNISNITTNTITVVSEGSFDAITANTISVAKVATISRLSGTGENGTRMYIHPSNSYWINTAQGHVYMKTAYTSVLDGEKNGILLSTNQNAYPVVIGPDIEAQKNLTVSNTITTKYLTLNGKTITGAAVAQICFATAAPAVNTVYNLWVNTNTKSLVLHYRTNTATSTWTPLGAVFK